MLSGRKMKIIILDELSRLSEELLAAINQIDENTEMIRIDSIPEELIPIRGSGKSRLMAELAAMELRMASPEEMPWDYDRRVMDYEKNPPRVPKNLKQTKAPKYNFRAQMRSVNRNR